MPLVYHPEPGTILICDYSGFIIPEMVKRRPVIVVSPRLRNRNGLCTVVPLSTQEPKTVMPYHYRLKLETPLPTPYNASAHWVKGDMFATVSFKRLNLPYKRKGTDGKRVYEIRVVDGVDFIKIRGCILHALGMTTLTDYL